MFYQNSELLYPIYIQASWLTRFQNPTIRMFLAAITALMISLITGPFMIEKLRKLKFGQEIREEGVKAHQSKRGTPTMGGVLIILATVTSTLLWAKLSNIKVWIVVIALLTNGTVGFIDDYLKIAKKHNLGLQGRHKLIGQFVSALLTGTILIFFGNYSTKLNIPLLQNFHPDIGWIAYLILIAIVMVGSSNAVNLTDGLDGLATSTTIVVASTFAGLAFITYSSGIAVAINQFQAVAQSFPNIVTGVNHIIETTQIVEIAIFCAALTGASLGFLWFNAPPAEVFMGDVGSLAIGGSIGCVAVILKQEFLLIIIGGIFVVEALSVILQTTYYKLTKDPQTGIGRRIFKMSPLHHHFELLGWKEPKIVFRFVIVQILFVLIGLIILFIWFVPSYRHMNLQ